MMVGEQSRQPGESTPKASYGELLLLTEQSEKSRNPDNAYQSENTRR